MWVTANSHSRLPPGVSFHALSNHMNFKHLQSDRARRNHRFLNPTIDPETGERLRPMSELENYNMQQQSSWAVRF